MDSVKNIDWKLLAQQKEHLCQLIYNNVKPNADLLQGLLNMIDAIQDESDELGLPVVYLVADEDA